LTGALAFTDTLFISMRISQIYKLIQFF